MIRVLAVVDAETSETITTLPFDQAQTYFPREGEIIYIPINEQLTAYKVMRVASRYSASMTFGGLFTPTFHVIRESD